MGEGTCAQCGTRFPKRFGGRGRPQEYCSEECREFSAALTILKKWAEPVAKRSTAAAWSGVRRDFWSLANASPAFQKDNAARSKARRAEEASLIAAGIIPVKGKQKVTFELVIGGTPISEEVYTSKAAADKAAKAFSLAHAPVVVDVRTVLGKERRSRFRAGKSVELLDAYKEFGQTDLRRNRGRGR